MKEIAHWTLEDRVKNESPNSGEASGTPAMPLSKVWLEGRSCGYEEEDLLKALGNPDNDPASDWLKWAGKHIDCTFHTGATGVSEIRFNPGFTGALANG